MQTGRTAGKTPSSKSRNYMRRSTSSPRQRTGRHSQASSIPSHNVAVDWVRKKRPVKYIDAEDDQHTTPGMYEAQSPLDRAVESNLFEEVRALLLRISPKDREIFGNFLAVLIYMRTREKPPAAKRYTGGFRCPTTRMG
jgi:hypothetical protein